MNIIGKQFIDGRRTAQPDRVFHSFDAATGEPLPHAFFEATEEEVAAAAAAAAAAFPRYRAVPLEERAAFLDVIAAEIDLLDREFVRMVMSETGLPEARILAERMRTSNQLRLFAQVVRRGDFLGARIDSGLPDRQPVPRPDIRQYRIPVGPVAVFGAGNFPLAFSVAGGDTASALAAGCPVIVKAHSGHPCTAEVVAAAVERAVKQCGMPSGVFGMLFGDASGAPLVRAQAIQAVGFTGSRRVGRILSEIAAGRPDPIPVFAEMSSVNPVIVLPEALKQRSASIAAGLADSVTLGGGQFCTNPGLIIGIEGEPFEAFCRELAAEIAKRPPAVMLSPATVKNYRESVARFGAGAGIEALAAGPEEELRGRASVFRADPSLLDHPDRPLEEEVFGPSTVVVAVKGRRELIDQVSRLQGHLTASLFASGSELAESAPLIAALETRAGRIILNAYPTGVEVCEAMVHGGPYPATSDGRFTSVGTAAIDRFLRPVCYQGYPDELLPPALQDGNPLGLRRLVNGEWES